MRIARHTRGFTVIELLVGLQITSIVLSAVAALAFAMSVASTASGDAAVKQAQLRQATVRVCELVGNAKLLCAAPGNDLAVWRADDNGDNQINLNELVYLERGETCSLLRLCQFSAVANPPVSLSDLTRVTTKSQFVANYDATYTPLIPVGKNVEFAVDQNPPRSRRLTISFDLTENNAVHHYEIEATVRASAQHLLSSDGSTLVSDDD